MATILLSAAGAAAGGALGGGAFGLSSVIIGRAIGATVGRAIDQRLMGGGSQVVETGRMDRMRVMGASEGAPIPHVFGRMRVAGNVIWTSRFKETVTTSQQRGGKGGGPKVTTNKYSYSISLAVALCEGEISHVGRIWADGTLISAADLNLRIYKGGIDQQPDPLMSAIEAEGTVPAYRGLAYVVIEDLPLAEFGNRVPQLTFEVVREAQVQGDHDGSVSQGVKAVAMMPGSGEFALASTPVYRKTPEGEDIAANVNSAQGRPDLLGSLDALSGELPNCKATSLVVSWFGNDLRVGECEIAPKVEEASYEAVSLGSLPQGDAATVADWSVCGLSRADAPVVPKLEGRAIYGGTPSDASVVEAITALRDAGQEVMFYPFILMDQLDGNSLPNPWTGTPGQPALPWRGRITTARAPGVAGSTDATAQARQEVARFMGTASPGDFSITDRTVQYSGPDEYSYRRFILHYAYLCKAAGGVSAFCIGSEMRGLTQIRDDLGAFPAVEALQTLAREVRVILGGAVKLGYAADWSEYFGYHPQDGSGDVLYHLDPLWAQAEIDFIGIDNYLPLADWRDGSDHLDAEAGTIYNLDYLRSNIRGGEGYEWYYRSEQERRLQLRTPIEDGQHNEPWVYRVKDLWNWWGRPHHERKNGVRSAYPTLWVPQSKPIWFTELGCGAVDKGANQPNKFQDPKSSEDALPHFSNGRRDDYMQMQYLRANFSFFSAPENNPHSAVYNGPMVDLSRVFIWAWDARPWPDFPNNSSVWSDGGNYATGHWLTGRTGSQPLAHVVAEICESAGVLRYDTSALHGVVRGFTLSEFDTPRAALQPLMVIYSFDAVERGGRLVFRNRAYAERKSLDVAQFALSDETARGAEYIRTPDAETVGEVRLGYVEAEGDFQARVADARFPGDGVADSTQNDVPVSLIQSEAKAVVERWLSEARVARDQVSFVLPPSRSDIVAGDMVELENAQGVPTLFRVDRVEDRGFRELHGVRVEPQIYVPSDAVETVSEVRPFTVPVPVTAQFMDLPLLKGDEKPHAPYVAALASPWPGGAAVYSSLDDSDYGLNTVVENPSKLGVLESPLRRSTPGLWQRGGPLRIRLFGGAIASRSRENVLNGANVAAIGDGSAGRWEIIQFSKAELVAPGSYALSDLLRGQAGSDGLMPDVWPSGSRIVILDGAAQQIDLDISARSLVRHYRIGAALRPYDDPSCRHYLEAFDGIGLKPYAPAHLRLRPEGSALKLSWVRRTRIEGDSWANFDVPLGEDLEAYMIRVVQNDVVLRETQTSVPSWSYSAADRAADGISGAFELHVAQISSRFGPGYFSRIDYHD